MLLLASEYLDCVKDVVFEGTVSYYGLLASALSLGHKLDITGNGYSTGWESLAVPVIAVDLEYRERSGATSYITTLTFSNRRAPFSGAALQRPAMRGQPLGLMDGTLGLSRVMPSSSAWSSSSNLALESQVVGMIRAQAESDTDARDT
jgi:hypothetical protein